MRGMNEAWMNAVNRGDLKEIVRLLDGGVAPDEPTSEFGHTALWIAATEGRLDLARALLARGADPNLPADPDVTTSLARACTLGAWAKSGLGDEAKQALLPLVDEMLARGGDASVALEQAIAHAAAPAVAKLVAAGAEVTDEVVDALDRQDAETAAKLKALEPALADDQLSRALRLAAASDAREEALEACARLLARGADPNDAEEGWTALTWAVTRENVTLVKLLLERGADPSIKIQADLADAGLDPRMTPGDIARQWNLEEIAALLPAAPKKKPAKTGKLAAKDLVGKWLLVEIALLPTEEGEDDGGFADEGAGELTAAEAAGRGGEYIELAKDGTLRGVGELPRGKWQLKGKKILVERQGRDPVELAPRNGRLVHEVYDEEHGRTSELHYERDA